MSAVIIRIQLDGAAELTFGFRNIPFKMERQRAQFAMGLGQGIIQLNGFQRLSFG